MKLSHHIHGQTLFLAILGLPLLATVLAAPVAVPYDAAISGTDSELSPREALYQVAERSAAAVVHDVQHEDSDLVKRGSDDYEKIAHDMHPRSTGGLYLIQESKLDDPKTRRLLRVLLRKLKTETKADAIALTAPDITGYQDFTRVMDGSGNILELNWKQLEKARARYKTAGAEGADWLSRWAEAHPERVLLDAAQWKAQAGLLKEESMPKPEGVPKVRVGAPMGPGEPGESAGVGKGGSKGQSNGMKKANYQPPSVVDG